MTKNSSEATRQGPVFLIASERSGTNLLRKRLTEVQGRYYGVSPAHFLKNLYYREPFYGPLDDDRNFLQLVQDALDLCYVHFSPWDIELTAVQVVHEYGARPRDAIMLSDYLMTRYGNHKGFDSYFCKDNFLYEFALHLATAIPAARFIYLYRDPRDFVLSQLKRPGSHKSVLRFARLWDYEQVKAIKASQVLKAEGRCYALPYERLISDEQRVLREVCEFLGVAFGSGGSTSADKIVDKVDEWKNLAGRTITDNSGKYARELSRRQIGLVELSCRQTMAFLGYSRVTDRRALYAGEALLEYAMAAFHRLVARLRFFRQPKTVQARRKLLLRLLVNYRNPG